MAQSPLIFDRPLLRARRRRAAKLGPSTFLIDRVAEDISDRLAVVLRRFDVAVDLGSPTDAVRRALAASERARLPRAYALEPHALGENSMARRLLQGLCSDDLVLLDAGFLCYGLLYQIHQQDAFFCLRLKKRLNLRRLKQLNEQIGDRDVLVWEGAPAASDPLREARSWVRFLFTQGLTRDAVQARIQEDATVDDAVLRLDPHHAVDGPHGLHR